MKDFKTLINSISTAHSAMQHYAISAVNQSLTIRNWLIGFYIVEYEQNGKDRAEYGKKLLEILEKEFKGRGIKGLTVRRFRDYRMFYSSYPQIRQSLTADLDQLLIRQSPTADLQFPILGSLTQESVRGTDLDNKSTITNRLSGSIIISKLSYTHLVELIKISDDLKRTFYEIETIKGTWSVRELKRQIASLYYERSGLSTKPKKLSELTQTKISPQEPTDIIKNIYAFEFLDISKREAIEESDLETALLDNLQAFILEMGNGFCFESRQKKILIGSSYYFIDIVFYHRILKCHVIVELKIGTFEHGDIGQLNTYLNYYKEEIIEKSDNDPVGILLVAEKDQALVKYATAGMDGNLFVQQYLVQLPPLDQLEAYINNELRRLT